MKQYGYTTVFRFVYKNEPTENFYYHCSDDYMPSDEEINEIKEDLEIGDNDTFELFGQTANDFNMDDYLSDRLRLALTREDTPHEYADLQLAYIAKQLIEKDDKVGIIKSLIMLFQEKCEFKQFREMYKVNLYTLNRLLYTIGEETEIQTNRRDMVVNQLKQVLGRINDEILLKLTTKENIRAVRHYLVKLQQLYGITEEKSKYRIAIILMLFIDHCKLLLPSMKGNLSIASTLIAEYYGIEPPKYRRNALYTYKDKNNPSEPMYMTILQEQEPFWNMLQL